MTGQVAAFRKQDGGVWHLSDTKKKTPIKGPFAIAAAWSGDGRYLFVAAKDKGLKAFQTTLSPAEQKVAKIWWQKIHKAPAKRIPARRKGSVAGPAKEIAALKAFSPQAKKQVVLAGLRQAVRLRRDTRPAHWYDHPPYKKTGL